MPYHLDSTIHPQNSGTSLLSRIHCSLSSPRVRNGFPRNHGSGEQPRRSGAVAAEGGPTSAVCGGRDWGRRRGRRRCSGGLGESLGEESVVGGGRSAPVVGGSGGVTRERAGSRRRRRSTASENARRKKRTIIGGKKKMSDWWTHYGDNPHNSGTSQQNEEGTSHNAGQGPMPFMQYFQNMPPPGMPYGPMGQFYPNMNRPPMGAPVRPHLPEQVVAQDVSDHDPDGDSVDCTPSRNRSKGTNFFQAENKILVSVWLFVTCDPIVGTGQKKDGYWKTISHKFNATRGQYEFRSQKSLTNRWLLIQKECTGYSACEKQVLMAKPSGHTDRDKTQLALALFKESHKHDFTCMHCWVLLKDEAKWVQTQDKRLHAGDTSKEAEDATQESQSV